MKRVATSKSVDHSHSNKIELKEPNDSELREPDEIQRVQHQLLDDETRALQVELTSLLDVAQETETKLVEMFALDHHDHVNTCSATSSTHKVFAVKATKNVELDNKELSQAIQWNSSGRTFILLFLFVMTFSIIFLDWVSLKSLGVSFLDLYLMHWPEILAFGVATDPPTKSKSEYRQFLNRFKTTWEAMEDLVALGLIRAIRVSNFSVQHIKELLKFAKIVLVVNQVGSLFLDLEN
ncbi:hypothetical protein Vadar_003177 [Vaccinium darrowii]|uniref:Uncharacterized protein n=1 Tax=Vaccinium darrowii TaxID=229202 RepID=A0ACB7XF61_9ERIC|nr:hypothetical protein Vadar_003177 [Vaccinium darrowii]